MWVFSGTVHASDSGNLVKNDQNTPKIVEKKVFFRYFPVFSKTTRAISNKICTAFQHLKRALHVYRRKILTPLREAN